MSAAVFPLLPGGAFDAATGLVVSLGIGFGFGFVLERAGFGNARRLAAQFYGTDMTVLKVMFTAIVTAMVGIFAFERLGWLDLGLVWVNPTYLWPQIAGGLLLGVGFILSGYCPGTSIVAAASGRVDGVLTLVGVFAGIGGYAVLTGPALESFQQSGAHGRLLLSDLLRVDPRLVVLGVVAMAAAAFAGAEALERRLGARAPRTRFLPVSAGLAVAAAIGLVLPSPAPAPPAPLVSETIAPLDLARHVIEGSGGWTILDLRPADHYEAGSIPRAVPLAGPDAQRAEAIRRTVPPHHLLVLVDGGEDRPPAIAIPDGYRAVRLAGGFPAWEREILTLPDPPAAPTPEALAAYRERVAIVSYFTGSAAPAREVPVAAPPALPVGVGSGPKPSGGCS